MIDPTRWIPGADRIGELATDWGYATGWALVRAVPEVVARGVFGAGAHYAARDGGPVQLRRNLARVLQVAPEQVPAQLIEASLASYARYWREAFRLPAMDHAAVAGRIAESVIGAEHVDAALAAGRGAVLALPHSGNWDMAGVWLAQTYGGFTTVAERLKPESLYRRFLAFREGLGFEVLPLSGGEQSPLQVLAQRLRDNRLVCLMADRDLTRGGVDVEFFGETTRLPAGPAKLAIETGAALLPTHVWFDGDGWRVRIQAPLDAAGGDVDAITQALADTFAAGIAEHPADWHMLQPQWLADLPEQRRTRLAGP